jgi:CBS domain-containing protein
VSPRTITEGVRLDAPILRQTDTLAHAVGMLVGSELPALPVTDEQDRYRGIFGEREFIGAVFPGYVNTLGYAGFVPRPIEDVLEKRREAAASRSGST